MNMRGWRESSVVHDSWLSATTAIKGKHGFEPRHVYLAVISVHRHFSLLGALLLASLP